MSSITITPYAEGAIPTPHFQSPLELKSFQKKNQHLCAGLGKSYDPLLECKRCGLNLICMRIKALSLSAKIEHFRKTDYAREPYNSKYFLDEYQQAVLDDEYREVYLDTVATSICNTWKKNKEPIPVAVVIKHMTGDNSPLNVFDYFRTGDERILPLILEVISSRDDIEYDVKTNTFIPNHAKIQNINHSEPAKIGQV